MRNFYHLFLYTLIGNTGLSQPDTTFWKNGTIREVRDYESADRYYTSKYHPNGQFHFLAFVVVQDDLEPIYSPIDTAFDASGKPTFLEGNGELIHYYEDLTIESVQIYVEGNLALACAEHYPNGNLKIKGSYGETGKQLTGYKQGVWKYYDSVGGITEERSYRNGHVSYVNYWKNGKQVLKNGEGYLEFWYNNGQLRSAGKVKAGKKYGPWKEYDPNGKVCGLKRYTRKVGVDYNLYIGFHERMVPTRRIGQRWFHRNATDSFSVYHANGEPSQIIYFSNGRADSSHIHYENGNLFKVRATNERVYFESGKLSMLKIKKGEEYYWSTDGTLIRQVLFQELSEGPYILMKTTNLYDANKQIRKQEVCLIDLRFNEYSGTEDYIFDCATTEWDEFGNEK